MSIQGFENVYPLEEEEFKEQNYGANSLCYLKIINSQCFFSCGRTKLALGFWKHFATLESLEIRNCNGLVYWPEEEFKTLRCLKNLLIRGCHSITGSLASSSSPTSHRQLEDSLPQLESLKIWDCPELVQIPGFSTPLKVLDLWKCPKLSREELSGFTNLKELNYLRLTDFLEWRALPDNMWQLPSLEKLVIVNCPGIESLPQSLQQRLPSLHYLRISDCPVLAMHFKSGGNYWDLASSIPDTCFSPQEEDEELIESEIILKRLIWDPIECVQDVFSVLN